MARPNADIPKTPLWETHARKPLSGGRVQGIDGSMWLYRTVPMGSVVDAKTIKDALKVATPLGLAFEELAQMATGRGLNRRMVQKTYRQFHVLTTNFPRWFSAPNDSPIGAYLNRAFSRKQVLDRRVMFGVRLVPTTGDGSVRSFMESAQQTLFEGGTPVSDYDKDYERASSALARAGLVIPTAEDFRAAEAWWNHGRNSDTPVLPHSEHLHFFRSMTSAETAQKEGLEDCEPWLDVPDHMAVTFCSVSDFDIGYTEVTEPSLWWGPDMLGNGARVISIRGTVEPPAITRQELKSQRRRVRNDLAEAAEKGKTDRASQEEQEAELDSIERAYDVNKAAMPPTLVDTSIVVGFAGVHRDITLLAPPSLDIHPMSNRQDAAWHETMLCSNVRANPYTHDLPATTVAYAGLPNLSVVGDKEGALLGFTQGDNQPAYLSATAASAGDAAPTLLVGAATGSGKALSLATAVPTPTGHTTMGELTVGDEVLGRDGKPCRVTHLSPVRSDRPAYVITFSDGQSVVADAEHQWVVTDYKTRQFAQWRTRHHASKLPDDTAKVLAERLEELAANSAPAAVTVTDILRHLHANEVTRWSQSSQTALTHALDFVDTPFDESGYRRLYDLPTALHALAVRMTQTRAHLSNEQDATERRITTIEMVDEGFKVVVGDRKASNFAVAVPEAAELPEVELPIEPYVLGVWLGDGDSDGGRIGSNATVLDDSGLSDQEHVMSQFAAYSPVSKDATRFGTRGLTTLLRENSLLHNKHIPVAYLRSSIEQRLQLLQGLMDSDGCIASDGKASFTQKDPALFALVVELIRSLGIKVNVFENETSYPVPDGRKVTGTVHTATFRTSLPVVTIPRKARRLPPTDTPKSRQLYITSIEQVDSLPMRCITVDSPDHTYLVADFVPTSNTLLLQWIAHQHALMGRPTVIIDPKVGSDLSPTVELTSGKVVSFDDFLSSDGGLDPLSLFPTPQMGIPLAASMLFRVNPWGDERRRTYEADIANGLRYGVERGATATGQALKMAYDAGVVPQEVVADVFKVAETYPMFRATFGMTPGNGGLSISNGITLFKVGKVNLELPPANTTIDVADMDAAMRQSVNIVRMLVRGSMLALAGRGGVLHMDEAWILERSAADELNEIGRLARSQNVLPILYTQTPTGPLNLGMSGYISRGLIGHISDSTQAEAGLQLFKAERDEVLERVTAPESLSNGAGLNHNSLKALFQPKEDKPDEREVVRGSVFYYSDLKQRFAPVEITLPAEFLADATTTPEEVARRVAEKARREA